jgi:3-hydroxybutyryl-CoA dehydrogenase
MSDRRISPDTPVAVIGAGSMGAGIAQLAAQSGHPVKLFDRQPGASAAALKRIDTDLAGAVQKGRIEAAERVAVLGRISVVDSVTALAGASLAVEAIVELLEPKKALFKELDGALGDDAVLATNTSSISITAIAQGLKQPQRVIGWHFFNPVTRMKLVEIIRGVETDPDLVPAMHALSKAWGKTSVDAPNAPGFIVNRVARPYYAENLRGLAEGVAAPQAIDRLLREAGGFAMGPFELIDLIGVDVNLSVTESVFAATSWDTRYAPHLIQQELVRAGRFGRKTGFGFYPYGDKGKAPAAPIVAAEEGGAPTLAVGDQPGLLGALAERLDRAGGKVHRDAFLAPETLRVGHEHVTLTDGRTLAARRDDAGSATVLLDLARDFATTTVVGATGAPEALAHLATALKPAGIEVIALDDVAGLVVMRTVACLVNEAADVMAWTGTRAADIDTSMRLGMAYPMGPLAWADAIGPDRVAGVLEHLQDHYGETRYRRSPRLSRARHLKETFHG